MKPRFLFVFATSPTKTKTRNLLQPAKNKKLATGRKQETCNPCQMETNNGDRDQTGTKMSAMTRRYQLS
eukprot:jgi/Psemu1/61603/gm1.61603_g